MNQLLPGRATVAVDPAARFRGTPAIRRAALEALEGRLLWSVSQDQYGWTIVTPSADSRLIYVSSSTGSDSNSGLSVNAPVASLAKAQSLVRNGYPDEVLLKSGDTFVGTFANWSASGRSTSEPMLISSYGTGARPLVNSASNSNGFSVNSVSTVNYVDVINIGFDAVYRDYSSPSTFNAHAAGGTTGFEWYGAGGNVLVEGCSFQYYRNNIDIEAVSSLGATGNFTLRRDNSSYSWSNSSHSQGLYAYGVNGISVLQSTFDHDGYFTTAGLAVYSGGGTAQAGFNHDMYFSSTNTGVVIEQDVIAEASYNGILARAGGVIDDNLFVNDTVDIAYGQGNGANSTAGGVTGEIVGNVVVGDQGLGNLTFGQGFDIGNTKPGAGLLVANNVFTGDVEHAKPAIELSQATGTYNPQVTVGENDVTIQNNVINGWYDGIEVLNGFDPGGTGLYGFNDVKVLDNDILNSQQRLVRDDSPFDASTETFAGGRYYDPSLGSANNYFTVDGANVTAAQWTSGFDPGGQILTAMPAYADPTRSVATYDATTGGPGTVADFLAQARAISRQTYQPQYTAAAAAAYVAAGYSMDTTAPTAVATTTNVNAAGLGLGTYAFAVTYTDNALLNPATLGSANVVVTGPNGFEAPATYVAAAAPTVGPGGYQSTVVTYQVVVTGQFAVGADGTYTVSVVPNQVKDMAGNAVAGGAIGTFTTDFSGPTASLTGTLPAVAPGANTYAFAVTYADPSGVDATTLNNAEVQVTGPAGYAQFAAITNTAANADGSLTVTYQVAGPAGGTFAAGTYAVGVAGGVISDLAGNTIAAASLGTFTAGGAAASTGSVTGFVFNDANHNGTFDAREVAMVGVTLFVDLAGTGVYAAGDPLTTTDVTGAYTFTSLPAGRYTVVEQVPTGYAGPGGSTTLATAVVNVAANTATVANFATTVATAVYSGAGTGGSSTATTTTSGVPVTVTAVPTGAPLPVTATAVGQPLPVVAGLTATTSTVTKAAGAVLSPARALAPATVAAVNA